MLVQLLVLCVSVMSLYGNLQFDYLVKNLNKSLVIISNDWRKWILAGNQLVRDSLLFIFLSIDHIISLLIEGTKELPKFILLELVHE